jgi:general secretion pathway protein E/type IV pilus assembly protein PilB
VGCATCAGTGYYGRLGIFELCQVDDNLRALIYAKAPAIRLRQQARRAGLRSMREDGVRKVLAGLTTIEEILAVTSSDPL